jgi:hypothetical protein
MTEATLTLTDFLLARLAEDEAAARACAEAFPSPWEVADRGWRVRIYAADVPDIGDHAEPGDTRAPCVIEVEPQRHHRELNDGGWLSDRVEHIARHDPARVLADVEAKRRIVEWDVEQPVDRGVLNILASVYADHPDFREEWRA